MAILQDLGGPKIRTGRLEGGRPLKLEPGETLTIATGDLAGGPGRLYTTFEGLARSVRPGDRLLLADGRIELRVDATDGTEIQTTVVEGGEIGEHKGINAPGVPLPASAITPKDVDDLKFGLSLGVDMVALSFVQSAADLRQARQLMADAHGADVPLIAKLERPQALEHLDEILAVVRRRDGGARRPRASRCRSSACRGRRRTSRAGARRHGIPVIVATQVLESMTTEARPTRAEVNDAANAVEDGVDAIMLAGETAAGGHPARAVQTLDAIIRDAETSPSDELLRRATDALHQRSCAGALRGGGDARQSRRRAGDCRGDARRDDGAAVCRRCGRARRSSRHRARRDGAAAHLLLGRGADPHRHRRQPRCGQRASRWSSSSSAASSRRAPPPCSSASAPT